MVSCECKSWEILPDTWESAHCSWTEVQVWKFPSEHFTICAQGKVVLHGCREKVGGPGCSLLTLSKLFPAASPISGVTFYEGLPRETAVAGAAWLMYTLREVGCENKDIPESWLHLLC